MCTYAEAGAAADEIVGNCFPRLAKDLGYLAFMCRHHDAERIVDKAYEYAAFERQGEVENGVAAFLAWLNTTYPKGGAR